MTVDVGDDEDQTDYQIILDIQGNDSGAAQYIDFTVVSDYGIDIRCYDLAATTRYEHVILAWDATAKTGKIVCEVPSITASTTFDIYVYFGNAGASDVGDYNAAMTKRNADSNTIALWHLDGTSGTSETDSSGNGNTLTLSSASARKAIPFRTNNPLSAFGPSSHYSIYCNSTYYAYNGTLLDAPPASIDIHFRVMFPSGYSSGGGTYRIFSKWNSTSAPYDLIEVFTYSTTGALRARLFVNNTGYTITGTTTSFTAGQWYDIHLMVGPDTPAGKWALVIDNVIEASNATTSMMQNGTAGDFIFGALYDGSTIPNAKIEPLEVYDYTNNQYLAQWSGDEGTGPTMADWEGNYDLTVTNTLGWDSTDLGQRLIDNGFNFTSGSYLNFAGTYYATAATVYDSPPNNIDISFWLRPNVGITSSLASDQYILSKYNSYIKALNCAGSYYATQVGTLLDSFNNTIAFEFSLYPTTTSGGTLIDKANDITGSAEDRVRIYYTYSTSGGAHCNIVVDIWENGDNQTTTSSNLSMNQWHDIRVEIGRNGCALKIDGTWNTTNDSYRNLPGDGTAYDLTYGCSYDNSSIYAGKLGRLRVIDFQPTYGVAQSVSSITHSGTTATVNFTGHGFPSNAYVTHAGCTGADADIYNITAQISVVDADSYTYILGSTPSGDAAGSPKARRNEGEVILEEWGLSEQSGTTIAGDNGNNLTASSASIWDASAAICDGLEIYFVNGSGSLRWNIYRNFANFSVDTQQTTWYFTTYYYIRVTSGYNGQFIYVNRDYDTYGNADFGYRIVPYDGTYDDFCLGAKLLSASASNQFNGCIDEVTCQNGISTLFRDVAHYERRKIVKDPLSRIGPVLTYDQIDESTWWTTDGRKNIGEEFVVYESEAASDRKYKCVFSVFKPDFSKFSLGLAYSADGIIWTDAGSVNPIIDDVQRPGILKDGNGDPIRTTVTANAWAGTTVYALEDAVLPSTPNGYAYRCTVAGTSSGSEPTWSTTPGDTFTDGSVTWECLDDDSDPKYWTFFALQYASPTTHDYIYMYTAVKLDGLIVSHGAVITKGSTYSIASINGDGAEVTVETSSAHPLAVGQTICIAGTTNYNSLPVKSTPGYVITSVADTTHFTYDDTATGSESSGTVYETDSNNLGNTEPYLISGTYYVYYDANSAINDWWVHVATGLSLGSLTKYRANHPCLKGPPERDYKTSGAPALFDMGDGTYRAFGHGSANASGTVASDIYVVETTDLLIWSYVEDKDPFILRNNYVDQDQITDPFVWDDGTDTYIMTLNLAWQSREYDCLYKGTNRTIQQILLPEPHISSSTSEQIPAQIMYHQRLVQGFS